MARITNRFGTLELTAASPDRLLAAAARCTGGTPCAAPDPLDHGVDAYACYKARVAAKFAPIRGVRIVDASGALTVYDLKKPTRLCTPADVNGATAEAPQTYLTCYQAVRAKAVCAPAAPVRASTACKREEDCGGTKGQTKLCQRQPAAGSIADIGVASQLGARRLRVKGKEELCVPPGSGAVSAEIGADGGTLSLGRFEVAVPPALLPTTVQVAVHELPSQADEVAHDLDPQRFRPFGPAYELEVPFVCDAPLTLSLSWDDADLPAGFAVDNLAVLLRDDQPRVEDPSDGAVAGVPRALFVPALGAVDPAAHRVQLEIFAGGTFQLVAMAAPIPIVEGSPPVTTSVHGRAALASIPSTPRFRVEFIDMPAMDYLLFAGQALYGLEAAYSELVGERGFLAPTAQVVVKVRHLTGVAPVAGTIWKYPLLIVVDPGMTLTHNLASVMAHEYFHVIQNWNSNAKSSNDGGADRNRWFHEGTAEWAADEVFDDVHTEYRAPDGTFFARPLNAVAKRDDPHPYESIVFWKWLESTRPGAIDAILWDHRGRTHGASSSTASIRNNVEASFLDSLVAFDPSLRYLDFAAAALYWKDFEVDETETGDLWHPERLGPPKELPAEFTDPGTHPVTTLRRGGDGDGTSHKVDLYYTVAPHLTADAEVIANAAGDDALSGTLHLEFPVPSVPDVNVTVIAMDTGQETQVIDLTAQRTVTVPFAAQTKVVVIAVDSQWSAPAAAIPSLQVFTAWVESCGGPTNQKTTKVASVPALVAALESAQPGDTVLLDSGTYYLGPREWSDGSWAALEIPPGVTFAGTGMTTIGLYPTEGAGADWIWPQEGATLRDLTIASSDIAVYYEGVHQVSLCNVTGQFNYSPLLSPGGFWLAMTPYEGTYTLDVSGGSYTCFGCPGGDIYGFWIQTPYVEGDPGSVRTLLRIHESSVEGWYAGVDYCTDADCGQVTIDAECEQFSGNEFNILDDTTLAERCP